MRWLLIILMVALGACKLTAIPPTVVCSEQHEWGDSDGVYHLPDNGLAVRIDNRSSYSMDLQPWTDLGIPLTLSEEAGDFIIDVVDGGDRDSGWLGLASVRLGAGNHLTRGTITMNRAILDRYEPVMARHVLCQELGHLLGLDHQRGADDSCLEDCFGRSDWLGCLSTPAGATPNAHDGEQLRKIYAHAGPTGDPLGPGCVGRLTLHTFWEKP